MQPSKGLLPDVPWDTVHWHCSRLYQLCYQPIHTASQTTMVWVPVFVYINMFPPPFPPHVTIPSNKPFNGAILVFMNIYTQVTIKSQVILWSALAWFTIFSKTSLKSSSTYMTIPDHNLNSFIFDLSPLFVLLLMLSVIASKQHWIRGDPLDFWVGHRSTRVEHVIFFRRK